MIAHITGILKLKPIGMIQSRLAYGIGPSGACHHHAPIDERYGELRAINPHNGFTILETDNPGLNQRRTFLINMDIADRQPLTLANEAIASPRTFSHTPFAS